MPNVTDASEQRSVPLMAPHSFARRSILALGLVALGVLWLVLLQVTQFNAVTVGLGFLAALAVMR